MPNKQIRTVLKFPDGSVLVFDTQGEQMPQYQGPYKHVRRKVLEDADEKTRFRKIGTGGTLRTVDKKEW